MTRALPARAYFENRLSLLVKSRWRVAATVVVVWVAAAAALLAGSAPTQSDYVATLAVPLVFFCGTCALEHVYRLVRRTVSDMSGVVEAGDRLSFERQVDWYLGRVFQSRVAVGFAVLGMLLTVALRADTTTSRRIVFYAAAALGWYTNGYGLGCAVGLILWIRSVSSLRLRLWPIPAHTFALRSTSRVYAQFALYFTIGTTLEIAAFFLIDWQSRLFVGILVSVMMVPLGILAALLFLWPQGALAAAVNKAKRAELLRLERVIREFDVVAAAHSPRDHAVVSRLTHHHHRLAASPSSPADLVTALRLIPPVVVSLAPALAQLRELVAWVASAIE